MPISALVWVRSFIQRDFLKTVYRLKIYHSNLSDQYPLEIRIRVRLKRCIILAFFTEIKENEHLFFCECRRQ